VGAELQLHPFLTSALDGGEWLDSHPGRLTMGEEPRVPLIQRLEDSIPRLEFVH
jgi:hypothetical protein